MNPILPPEAVDFGTAADRAFAALGGVDAARGAEVDPSSRSRAIAATLDGLGLRDIDPRADADTAAAAASLARAAGRVALPYPVVPLMLAVGEHPLAVVPDSAIPIDHGDLFPRWAAVTISGAGTTAEVSGGRLGSRLGPFVSYGSPGPPVSSPDVALHLTLTAWQILGTVERALELAVQHVTGRIQFGKPISSFQAVQFQLADAAVAVDGLREMCTYALWRACSGPALVDALAARLAALDAARLVLRTTQQLHGAAGVCDEYDISVLIRHVQPSLRIPFGVERTATEMAAAVRADGFDSLFAHGAGAS